MIINPEHISTRGKNSAVPNILDSNCHREKASSEQIERPENHTPASAPSGLNSQLPTPATRNNVASQSPGTSCSPTTSNANKPGTPCVDKTGKEVFGCPDKPDETLPMTQPDTHAQKGADRSIDELCKTVVTEVELSLRRPVDPKTIAGAISCVLNMENRLTRLEVLRNSLGEQVAQKGDTDYRHGYNPPQDGVVPSTGNVVRKVQFFHAKNEWDWNGRFLPRHEVKGSFMSRVDPNNWIRVIYDWSEELAREGSRIVNDGFPEPGSIEILAFGVMSKPLARFFDHRLGIPYGTMLRFTKPFRPLMVHLKELRSHLRALEQKFGHLTADSDSPSTSSIKSVDLVNGHDVSYRSRQGEVEPFRKASAEETGEPEVFNTLDALLDFRGLFIFLEEYLAKHLRLFDRLTDVEDGLEDTIAFENLWMLFGTHATIYCPYREGEIKLYGPHRSAEDEQTASFDLQNEVHTTKSRYVPQAFQVLHANGGLPLLNTMASKGTRIDGEEDNDNIGDRGKIASEGPGKLSDNTNQPRGRAGVTSARGKQKFSPLIVSCFHIGFDGVKYLAVREFFIFRPFDGQVDIRSLEAYPTKYLQKPAGDNPPQDILAEDKMLLQRGKKFIEATAISHLSYEGLTVGKNPAEISSEVIIDLKLFFQEYHHCIADGATIASNATRLNGVWPHHPYSEAFEFYFNKQSSYRRVKKIANDVKSLLEELQTTGLHNEQGLENRKQYMEANGLIMLLPGVVPAFVLRNRKWVNLDLRYLHEVKKSNDWQDLVLPKGHKDIVQAMVATHTRGIQGPNWDARAEQGKIEMDLVRGKGKGCIILLHGEPGVGKTSTAGDIGQTPHEVEAKMENHFKLAQRWGCVLLLDEADVFLTKRDRNDIVRNGLVSVFLRILEYYSGILFLTTNRVGAIDDAFRSRLHLTLHYPRLTTKQTAKIWANNLERLKAINHQREQNGQLSFEFDKEKVLRWARHRSEELNWNGRQIRNAFQTAVALAEYEFERAAPSDKKSSSSPKHPVMTKEHFKLIAAASKEFNQYLNEIYGADEDKRAKAARNRTTKGWDVKKSQKSVRESSDASSSEASDTELHGNSSDEDDVSAAEKRSKRGKIRKSDDDNDDSYSSDEGKKSEKTKKKSEARLKSTKERKEKDKRQKKDK